MNEIEIITYNTRCPYDKNIYKERYEKKKRRYECTKYGVIAQDIQKIKEIRDMIVFPEKKDNNEYLTVNYGNFNLLNIMAIQELTKIVNDHTYMLNKLHSQNNDLMTNSVDLNAEGLNYDDLKDHCKNIDNKYNKLFKMYKDDMKEQNEKYTLLENKYNSLESKMKKMENIIASITLTNLEESMDDVKKMKNKNIIDKVKSKLKK